jgi:uncharacterized phage protein gp47/JayE
MEREIEIQNEMLNDIPNEYDKNEGSFIYIATRPPAIKLAAIENEISKLTEKLDIDNLSGDELALRVKDRTGISRKVATFSVGMALVSGNGRLVPGDIFETESGIQFVVTEEVDIIGNGMAPIKCTQAGPIGNVPANQINFIPITIAGINSVTTLEPTRDGFPEESDQDLLSRYYERIRTPATSGNKAHYKNWAKEVQGVGDAKVFPLWAGDNTVKVVVIDSDRKPASLDIVQATQEYIDPGITGMGLGEAPLGAFCTVESAKGKEIQISFSVTKQDGYTDEDVMESVSNNSIQYFKSIAFIESYVSYAQIGSLILNSEGVADYSSLIINGGNENIQLEEEEVPVLGGVFIV